MTIGTYPDCGVEVTEEHRMYDPRESVENYVCPACYEPLSHECPNCGSGEPTERFRREGT